MKLPFVFAATLGLVQVAPADTEQQPATNPRLSPDQVENQLAEDAEADPLYDSRLLRPLKRWRDQLSDDYGLRLGLDYSSVAVVASDSPGDDQALSGIVRFFGAWDLVQRTESNKGSLIWKVEHRHRMTDIPVSDFGLESGYVGSQEPPFSNQGLRLTNLYWKQGISDGKGTLVAGFVDATDFVDVYLLASPWTGFMNFAFSTGSASMDLPNDATLGAAAGHMLTENFYAQAGISDANTDPTEPFEGFESVVDDSDFYKWIEAGWTPGQENLFFHNAHLTFWHMDERADGTPDGWGLNLSYQRWINDKWLPFVRGGYADDGGSLLEHSISAGIGYQPIPKRGVIGLGANWGKPNESSFGDQSEQFTTELFWRYQLTKELAITPGLQYINNPALNPDTNHLWVAGLRARFAL